MSESDWTVEVLEKSDVTAGGEPFMGLMATRAPFDTDTHQETGPVLAVVRTGTDRDRIFIDLSHESGGFTFALGAPPGPTNASGEFWLRIEAEDLWQDRSKVRILRFDVDWQAGWAQELPKKPTCIAVWRKDSDTPKDLWGPPEDRDGPELLSFLSKLPGLSLSGRDRRGRDQRWVEHLHDGGRVRNLRREIGMRSGVLVVAEYRGRSPS